VPWVDQGATLPIAGILDNTGLNSGNYTLTLNQQSGNLPKVGNYTIWHMVLEDLVPGFQIKILWNSGRTFGFLTPAGMGSEFWGAVPMRQSDQLFFLFAYGPTGVGGPNPAPVLTAYTGYDPSDPGNQQT
jgi:hypothetical protein